MLSYAANAEMVRSLCAGERVKMHVKMHVKMMERR